MRWVSDWWQRFIAWLDLPEPGRLRQSGDLIVWHDDSGRIGLHVTADRGDAIAVVQLYPDEAQRLIDALAKHVRELQEEYRADRKS